MNRRHHTVFTLSVMLLAASTWSGCASSEEEEELLLESSELSDADFDTTVQQLTNLSWLPWDYTPDGCYARALYYSAFLAARGIASDHVYVFANNGSEAPGKQLDTGSQQWDWHVAPLVSHDDHPNVLYVLDPALNQSRALTTQEWIDAMGVSPGDPAHERMYTTPGSWYGVRAPSVSALFNSIANQGQHIAAPESPDAQSLREPTFSAMRPFYQADLSSACHLMHCYLRKENAPNRSSKHRQLANQTQRLVDRLDARGKLIAHADDERIPAEYLEGIEADYAGCLDGAWIEQLVDSDEFCAP